MLQGCCSSAITNSLQVHSGTFLAWSHSSLFHCTSHLPSQTLTFSSVPRPPWQQGGAQTGRSWGTQTSWPEASGLVLRLCGMRWSHTSDKLDSEGEAVSSFTSVYPSGWLDVMSAISLCIREAWRQDERHRLWARNQPSSFSMEEPMPLRKPILRSNPRFAHL